MRLREDIDQGRAAALLVERDMEPWILMPLGNPGEAYTATRHNMGRILVQRWMEKACPRAGRIHAFATGAMYALKDPFLALVPGTYMNLSGQAAAEAVKAGFSRERLLVLHDDKDLPLGVGRIKRGGGDGGHNGLKSLTECLETPDYVRIRLGIGPFQRPLADFVLGEWTDEEWAMLDALEAPFAAMLDLLASDLPLDQVMSRVNADTFWRGTEGAQ